MNLIGISMKMNFIRTTHLNEIFEVDIKEQITLGKKKRMKVIFIKHRLKSSEVLELIILSC